MSSRDKQQYFIKALDSAPPFEFLCPICLAFWHLGFCPNDSAFHFRVVFVGIVSPLSATSRSFSLNNLGLEFILLGSHTAALE